MYNIPILDQNQRPITELNNNKLREFNNIYRLNLNDELIKPLSYYNPVGIPIASYTKTGLNNIPMSQARKYLFSNNYDSTEEEQYTDEEMMQFLQNSYNAQPKLTEIEKQIQPYENLTYSPEFRQLLIEDSIKKNSNSFFLESQDFVKEYQDSLNNMHKEANLFEVSSNDTNILSGLLIQQNKLQEINNMLLREASNIENKKIERYKNKMNKMI
jgi:hypothetical protein